MWLMRLGRGGSQVYEKVTKAGEKADRASECWLVQAARESLIGWGAASEVWVGAVLPPGCTAEFWLLWSLSPFLKDRRGPRAWGPVVRCEGRQRREWMKESIGSLGGKYPVWVLSPGLVTASLFQLLTFLVQMFFFWGGVEVVERKVTFNRNTSNLGWWTQHPPRPPLNCLTVKVFKGKPRRHLSWSLIWGSKSSPSLTVHRLVVDASWSSSRYLLNMVKYKLALTKSIANDWTTKAFAISLYGDWIPCC